MFIYKNIHSIATIVCSFALLLCLSAQADPLLNGLSIHTELGKERFIAGLSVSSLSTNSRDILITNEDKRIQVRILADRISARSFKRMWIEGMAINASSSELTENAQNMADFSNMLKVKLVAGDIFSVDRSGGEVNVVLNGITLGTIPSTKFFDLLLRTWIGPVPLSSDFRDGLLMAGKIDDALLSRFDATYPSDERIAAIQGKIDAQPKAQPKVDGSTPAVAVATQVEAPIPPPAVVAPAVGVIAAPGNSAPAIPSPNEVELAATQEESPAIQPPTPAPTPVPVQQASIPKQALLDADLMDEEEDDLDFTAEGLLQQQLYIASLKKWSYKYLSYPRRAMDRGWEGNVRLSITINRDGEVLDVVITEEAKHSTLTKEAVRAAKRASPFPPIPNEIGGEEFAFTLPVVFKFK